MAAAADLLEVGPLDPLAFLVLEDDRAPLVAGLQAELNDHAQLVVELRLPDETPNPPLKSMSNPEIFLVQTSPGRVASAKRLGANGKIEEKWQPTLAHAQSRNVLAFMCVPRLRPTFLGAVREVGVLAQKGLAQRRTSDADPRPLPALQAAWRVHARVARPLGGRSARTRGPDDNGRGGTGGAGARAGGAGSGANRGFGAIRFDEAVSLVMGAAGVAVMLHSAREVLLISDMQRWCRSEGQIVRSKIEEAKGGITSSAGKRCNVDVTYSFPDAQGQVHIAHYQAVVNSSEARGLVEGQPCVVLFDPSFPRGHSTILQGDEARAAMCQQCAGVRAVFGAALVAYASYVILW